MANNKFLDLTGLKKVINWSKNTFVQYNSDTSTLSTGGGNINKVVMTDGVITNTTKSQNIGIVRGVGSTYQSGIYGMFNGATKDRNTQFFLTHQQDVTLADGTKISFPNLTIKDLYANGNVRNQLFIGYNQTNFEAHKDSLYIEMPYCDADDGKINYKARMSPGKFQAVHYVDGTVDRYVLFTYKGIKRNDGKDVEVFNTNEGTLNLSNHLKIDPTSSILTNISGSHILTINLENNDSTESLVLRSTGISLKNATENDCFTANGGTYDLTQKLDVSARITEADIDAIFK